MIELSDLNYHCPSCKEVITRRPNEATNWDCKKCNKIWVIADITVLPDDMSGILKLFEDNKETIDKLTNSIERSQK